MTAAESSNDQKDNIGIRWKHITQAPTPAACGRCYSPLRITKEDPTVICPTMPLYQTNSLHFTSDKNNTELCMRAPVDPEDWVISLFSQVLRSRGRTVIPGGEFPACTDQLDGLLTVIFHLSSSQSVMPTCLKQTTIVPVPENS